MNETNAFYIYIIFNIARLEQLIVHDIITSACCTCLLLDNDECTCLVVGIVAAFLTHFE